MRSVLIALFAIWSCGSLAETGLRFHRSAEAVDLDRPDALESLRQSHPTHHRAVEEILVAARRLPCDDHELKAIQVRYDVRQLGCGMMLLTSYPAQRRISFEIEDVSYFATVRLDAAESLEHAK